MALVATAFAFAVRGAVLKDWGVQYHLTEEQKGIINGVGTYPFAISIILFSLIIDRIGYGTAMCLRLRRPLGFDSRSRSSRRILKCSTLRRFLYALSNGMVEAVINPVVATLYKDNKTHWLNVLHAGWPGGMVLGRAAGDRRCLAGDNLHLPGQLWQWQMAVLLLPDPVLRRFAVRSALSRAGTRRGAACRTARCSKNSAGERLHRLVSRDSWASARCSTVLDIQPIEPKISVKPHCCGHFCRRCRLASAFALSAARCSCS